MGVTRVDVTSSADMFNAVTSRATDVDMIFKAAAVADYTPVTVYDHKVKKSDDDMSIPLKRTSDILGEIAKTRRDDQIICGFAMETENLIENARGKLPLAYIYPATSSMFSMKIPYPLVGSFTRTWVTAPTNFPS
jgi:phosphopantothenoylcysteine decarboxylase/phosphopantothenate--cysteine ligase